MLAVEAQLPDVPMPRRMHGASVGREELQLLVAASGKTSFLQNLAAGAFLEMR